MKGKLLSRLSSTGQRQLNIYPVDFCVVVSLLCDFLILLGEPMRSDAIVSLGSRGLLLLFLAVSALQILAVIKAKNAKNAYYLLAVIGAVAVSAVLSGPMSILQHAVQLICFFMLPGYLLLYKDALNVKLLQEIIYKFNWFCTGLWTLLFFSSRSHIFYGEYSAITLNELTLGYANPNQTGMLLMVSFIIAFSAWQRDIPKNYKRLYLVQCLWTLIMLYQTDSRPVLSSSASSLLCGSCATFQKSETDLFRSSFSCPCLWLFCFCSAERTCGKC